MKWAFFDNEPLLSKKTLKVELFRYRVVTVTAPRMATQNAAYGKIETFECPMFLNSLDGILRASRREPAGRRRQRTNAPLIETDRQNEQATEHYLDKVLRTGY